MSYTYKSYSSADEVAKRVDDVTYNEINDRNRIKALENKGGIYAHDIRIQCFSDILIFRLYTSDDTNYTTLSEVLEALVGESSWQGDRVTFVPMTKFSTSDGNAIFLNIQRMSWSGNELQVNYDITDVNASQTYRFASAIITPNFAYLYSGYFYLVDDSDYLTITDNVVEV